VKGGSQYLCHVVAVVEVEVPETIWWWRSSLWLGSMQVFGLIAISIHLKYIRCSQTYSSINSMFTDGSLLSSPPFDINPTLRESKGVSLDLKKSSQLPLNAYKLLFCLRSYILTVKGHQVSWSTLYNLPLVDSSI
jgi:hypothetical protein